MQNGGKNPAYVRDGSQHMPPCLCKGSFNQGSWASLPTRIAMACTSNVAGSGLLVNQQMRRRLPSVREEEQSRDSWSYGIEPSSNGRLMYFTRQRHKLTRSRQAWRGRPC